MNNNDLIEKKERLLLQYIKVSYEAREILSRLKGREIENIDIQLALMEVFKLEDEIDLIEKELSAEKIINLLKDFCFLKYHPEVLCEIQFDESIIPSDVPRLLTEVKIKNRGEIWIIHKNDLDPFPSNPRAKNYEAGLKLDLSSGDLYDRRKHVGKISEKKLSEIREKAKAISLPPLKI